MKSKKYKSLSTLFLFLVGMALSASLVGAFSHPGPALERMSNEGGVKISVRYLSQESDQEDEASFRINMSTHYVDLSGYDLKKNSFISVDNGPPDQATEWVASGNTHHVQGILRFTGPRLQDAQSVRLIVRDIGASGNRVFEWSKSINK
jgi:hypothetical protein